MCSDDRPVTHITNHIQANTKYVNKMKKITESNYEYLIMCNLKQCYLVY